MKYIMIYSKKKYYANVILCNYYLVILINTFNVKEKLPQSNINIRKDLSSDFHEIVQESSKCYTKIYRMDILNGYTKWI
jgi:hypothetical protein